MVARFGRWANTRDADDMESDAMLGLARWVETWDEKPLANVTREAFLRKRLRSSVIDGMRLRNGRKDDGYPKQEREKAMYRLDREIEGSNETMLDRFLGREDRDLADVGVLESLDRLPEREREAIVRTILEGATLLTLSKEWGVSESRVSQIRSSGLRRLRTGVYPPKVECPPKSEQQEPTGDFGLSKREIQILDRMSHGLRNEEIGKDLIIGVETVKSHIRHILMKMTAKSRTHAVSIAFRHRLIH